MVYDIYTTKIKKVLKDKGANNLLKVVDKNRSNLLYSYFLRWWKNTPKTEPNRSTKVKTKLRRIIKYNETEPISKYFHKWYRNANY